MVQNSKARRAPPAGGILHCPPESNLKK